MDCEWREILSNVNTVKYRSTVHGNDTHMMNIPTHVQLRRFDFASSRIGQCLIITELYIIIMFQ